MTLMDEPSASSPLPIFTDDAAAQRQPCAMLAPLLNSRLSATNASWASADEASRLFRLVPQAEATYAVLAWDWETARADPGLRRFALGFIRANAARGLATLVFHPDDSEAPVRLPDTLVFRTSIVRGRSRPHEHAFPWIIAGGPPAPTRPYRPTPSVGFCGATHRNEWRRPTLFRRLFRRHRNQYPLAYPRAPGLRALALDALRASRAIEAVIIERDRFMGGAVRPDGSVDPEIAVAVHREFVTNLFETDYALCMRGAGNFSIRFYEALAAGRVPLLIDTRCILPWPDLIDWDAVVVRIDASHLDELGERLLAAHEAMGPAGFAERQRLCREVWERHLSGPGCFRTLRRWLETAI